ncbi:MAG: ferritin-like domain-containing protein [Bdellovibrionales bacterium]|nr:ferritin-like domain-containing protein [Oligoflexia bacterium]
MGRFSEIKIDWAPFVVCAAGIKAPYPRALSTPEGLGDRLRFVAFAEKQATHAFAAAAELFPEVSEAVKKIWLTISREEEKHLTWLIYRMRELGVVIEERPQSLALWKSFDHCENPARFAEFMASAEERGRSAGVQFYETLLKIDAQSARLFQQIAKEEEEHIRLAKAVIEYNFQVPDDFNYAIDGLPLEQYGEI